MRNLISPKDLTKLRRKLNILIALRDGKSTTKGRLMASANLSYSTHGHHLIDDLVAQGYIDRMQLRGDHHWLSISPEGRVLLKTWDDVSPLLA